MAERVVARETETDVLVIGAGPTGLMLANCLAKLGVDAVLADGKDGPTVQSRALGVQARTMELYDQLGMADRVLARCTPAQGVVPGFRQHAFSRVNLPEIGAELSPYPRIYVLEQSENERLLVENLALLGRSVRWNSRLVDLEETAGDRPVRADLSDGIVLARYCVGADGSASQVRKLMGIPFEGETNPFDYFVLDAVGVRGVVRDHINVRMAPSEFLLSFPMGAGDSDRLLGVVRNVGAAAAPTEERVRGMLANVFRVSYDRSRWYSTYRVHHRIAVHFRRGPFFLAGDAAHVHSPVGAQGMNTGLQDAHNLACKLADVMLGRASDASLDRYEAERRPVAERLVRTTDRLFGAVTSERRLPRFVRSRIVPVVVPIGARVVPRLPVARRLFSYISQIRIHYWMSPGAKRAAGGRRGRVVGRRLPWSGENFASLRAMSWQVHGYSEELRSAAAAVADELRLTPMVFGSPGFARMERDQLYLVRPDGFVAASAGPERATAEFRTHLTRLAR